LKNKIITSSKQLGKPVLAGVGRNNISSELVSMASQYGGNGSSFNTDTFESDTISRFPAEIRNPTLNPEMFFLPKFLSNDGSPNIELNTWFDHYYRFHPLVGNLIDLHKTLPLSRFGLVGIQDNKMLQEYEELSEDLQMFEIASEMFKAYFLRGEYALYARWNDTIKSFSHLKLLDTNYINVTGHYLLFSDKGNDTEAYELTPDEYLQSLVNTDNEIYQKLVSEYLDDEIRDAIENGFTIMMDPFSMSFEKRTVNPWDLRGTSILCNILKTLILEDKLREFQYANAQANTTPIYLWNVGDNEYPADDAMIQQYQALIQQLGYDPNKNIIANHLLKLTIQGASGQAKDMYQDFEYIQNLILTSLWGNKAFTTSEGITYNSSSVAMRVLMGRYIPIRNGLENIFYRKIFLPIAIARGYYKRTDKEQPNGVSAMIRTSKKFEDLVIPKFDWRHKQSLMDDSNVRSMLIQLHQMGKIPFKTICDSLDLDYDYTMTWLEKESNTIFDPFINDAKKTLMNSALAGGLADKGEGMMKRVMDASSAFMKALTGKSPNVDVIDKGKDDKKEDEPDEKETEKIKKEFGFDKTADIDNIIRKNADKIEQQLSEPRKFKTVFSSNDLLIQKLSENYYDKEFIGLVKEELYDLKILLAKQGTEYVHTKTGVVDERKKVTVQECVNYVIEFNKEEYNNRLRKISELAVDKIDNGLNKEAILYYTDFDKYALSYKINELEVVDKSTLQTYWNTINPELQVRAVLNMVDTYRRKQIQSYRKLGVKEFYVNGIKTDVDNHVFNIEDRLVPDFEYKKKLNVKISKNFSAVNIPFELVYSVKDLDKRFKLKGSLDYSDDTFDTVLNKTAKYYLGYIYDHMNNYNDVIDLESKFSEGETDEREFFINQGRKYLNNANMTAELKEYFKNLYI